MKMIVANFLTLVLEKTLDDGRIPQHWKTE